MRFLRIADVIVECLAALGVLAYCAAAVVTVADILGRRIGMPVVGVVDIVQLFVMTGAWLVIPWGFAVGAHVGVDFLVDRMPAHAARACRIAAGLAACALMALILWKCFGAWQLQHMLGDKSQQLGIPISFYWLPLLAGAAASILALAAMLARLISGQPVTPQAAH
ncbi:MAG: TRAP transporter small permease subunit [Paracoccus sp. (in: a-proteobacteria)]|nr:TRAP transporter small permease subunit [Paracoccus sp. (in: a-proteobacteria)]